MDHAYWPFVTTKLYMDQTGDLDILLDKVSYFKDRQSLRGTAHDDEWKFEDGNTQKTAGGVDYFGTVIEHILLQNLCAFYDVGEHNEMRLHGADWNDALDMAWERGESVAFTCAYAGNLKDIAYYLRKIESTDGIRIIEVAKEMECLFRKGKELYENPYKKQQLLSEYSKLCCHNISGEKAVLKISMICENLEEKADWLMKNIRENEWIKEDDNTGWFNGYYDNHGKKVEYYKKDDVRMMLMPEPEFKRLCEGAQNIVKKEEVKKDKTRYQLSNDYQGFRYDTKLTTKEIAIKIRAYCKTQYPDYKFSVRVDRSEINVKILSGPQEIRAGKGLAKGNWQTIGITDFYRDWLSDGAYKMLYDITQYAKSYNRSNTDIQNDYFDENFYFRLDIGAWDRPYTVTPEIKPQTGITKSGTLQKIESRIVSQQEANHRSGPEKTI